MAAQIEVGEEVYLEGTTKITISSIDTSTIPFRYYFKQDGEYVFCNRKHLTKRKIYEQ